MGLFRSSSQLSTRVVLTAVVALVVALVTPPAMSAPTAQQSLGADARVGTSAVIAKKKSVKRVVVLKSSVRGAAVITGPGGFRKAVVVTPKGSRVVLPRAGTFRLKPAKNSPVKPRSFTPPPRARP